MEEISMYAVDTAKSVFQLHGEDAARTVRLQKRLRRGQVLDFFARLPGPVGVVLEACGAAHHWARELMALGHEVRLIPPQHVKPFLKRNKNDARDAEAIFEAALRPGIHFVPIKPVAQQCDRALHRGRDLLVRQRSQLGNIIRSLLAEMGIVAPPGAAGSAQLYAQIEADDAAIPPALRVTLKPLLAQWRAVHAAIEALGEQIQAAARADARVRRLMKIDNVGPITAHAMVAAIGDGKQFRSARDFAAWAGLTPTHHASADKMRIGHISKAGDRNLRRLFVLGASCGLHHARAKPDRAGAWVKGLLARRPVKVAVIAQAAKTARIAWAVLTSGEDYRSPAAA
ncbi:MAG: IS110 family transposase [Caulobacteraceae bacterium]|nr:IS110 family transposase [Caulobacteraceae bacterium]